MARRKQLTEAQRQQLLISEEFWFGFEQSQADDAKKALKAAIESGDAQAAAANAWLLGGLAAVNPFIDCALAEIEMQPHRRKGGRKTKLTDQKAADALAERQRLIERGHTKHDACQIVGERVGVSYKTIDRL